MTEHKPCPKCGHPMNLRRINQADGTRIENPTEWGCGQCATRALFGNRGDNYIAPDILEGRTNEDDLRQLQG